MRTLVFDAGAFIAAERRDRRLATFLAAAEKEGATILLPAPVVAEVWREPPRQCSVGLLSTADRVVDLDLSRASAVGALLGKARRPQIVDGSVAEVAVGYRPSLILTSDADDLQALVKALGVTCSLEPTRRSRIDVLIALL